MTKKNTINGDVDWTIKLIMNYSRKKAWRDNFSHIVIAVQSNQNLRVFWFCSRWFVFGFFWLLLFVVVICCYCLFCFLWDLENKKRLIMNPTFLYLFAISKVMLSTLYLWILNLLNHYINGFDVHSLLIRFIVNIY